MATGHSTTLNNITINGVTYNGVVDLENVFHALGTATPAANVGFVTSTGADLAALFYPRSLGGTTSSVPTGMVKGTTDLRDIFAVKGSVSTGGGGGGGGCLPFGTRVLLWDSGDKAIEDIVPGDVVIGYYVDGMIDESEPGWREWKVTRDAGKAGALIPVAVVMTLHAEYPAHYLINGALRATYEHTFLVLRGDEWAWRQSRDLQPGDAFLSIDLKEVPIESVEFVKQGMRVANIDVEEVDCFMFEGIRRPAILSHNPTGKE